MNNKIKPPCREVFMSYNKKTKELNLYHACFTKLETMYVTWAPCEIQDIFNRKGCCLCGSKNFKLENEEEVKSLLNAE